MSHAFVFVLILIIADLTRFFFSISFSTTTQSSTHNTGGDLMSSRPGGEVRTWLDDFNSPLIQEDGSNKCLKLRFDVSQYAPEEIVVKTVDNKLLVSKLKKLFNNLLTHNNF